jgi:hypothetical protein
MCDFPHSFLEPARLAYIIRFAEDFGDPNVYRVNTGFWDSIDQTSVLRSRERCRGDDFMQAWASILVERARVERATSRQISINN